MYKYFFILCVLLSSSAHASPMYVYCTNGKDWKWLKEDGRYVTHYFYPQKIAHIKAVQIHQEKYKRLSRMCNSLKRGWFPQVAFSGTGDWYVFWYLDKNKRIHIAKGIATDKGKG